MAVALAPSKLTTIALTGDVNFIGATKASLVVKGSQSFRVLSSFKFQQSVVSASVCCCSSKDEFYLRIMKNYEN